MGRPPYLTPEQREESRIRQNKKRSLRAREKLKAKRAARAIAEGREPGKVGQPRVLTDEQRAANREETFRKYREANRDKIRKRDAKLQKHKRAKRAIAEGRPVGRVGVIRRFSDKERRDKRLKNSLTYWEKNPEKRKELQLQYYANNKDAVRANVSRRRARKFGNGGDYTVEDVRAVWDRQAGICAFCSLPLERHGSHLDHWIPLFRGGSNGPENLRFLHAKCNLKKSWKLPSELGLPD